jgi:hypothetical protein
MLWPHRSPNFHSLWSLPTATLPSAVLWEKDDPEIIARLCRIILAAAASM